MPIQRVPPERPLNPPSGLAGGLFVFGPAHVQPGHPPHPQEHVGLRHALPVPVRVRVLGGPAVGARGGGLLPGKDLACFCEWFSFRPCDSEARRSSPRTPCFGNLNHHPPVHL